MSTARHLPISNTRFRALIERALLDLRRARRIGDTTGADRCERRMNALLEQWTRAGETSCHDGATLHDLRAMTSKNAGGSAR